MEMHCERRVITDPDFHFDAESESGSVRDLRRFEEIGGEEPQDCDGCGVIVPDVDLWAENFETGEEIWLCMTCGGW